MEQPEEIKEAKDILQSLIKAKKTFRMYPHNNPIYIKTLDETYERFKNFFDYKDNFLLKIKQNSIAYDSEQIYYNPEKEDNLALFFFKDGLRELIFKNGLLRDELEEFLKIIALDFDREVIDDDIVTLLWEKDFKNIQYVVDEAFLIDIDEDDYATIAEEKVKEKITQIDDLMRAYTDGFHEEDVKGVSIVPLTDKDLQLLVHELEKDTSDKAEKLVAILFELIYQAESKNDLEDIFAFLRDTINFSMKHGDIYTTINIMKRAKDILDDPLLGDDEKKYIRMLYSYLGTEEVISLLAEILDSGIEIEDKFFKEFVGALDRNAILPFIKFLGELKTIRARKSVIEALIVLGKRDIQALSRGLEDNRWYVVRNIIYVLRKIGDKRAIEYLLKTVRHGDIRVRKEVIKTLGELGGREVIQTLKDALSEQDMQVRITAVKALGTMGSEVAKKIIIDDISKKKFKEKDFDEKKEFYEVVSRWKDAEVFNFLIKALKRKAFFGRSRNFENRACAAFSLGLLGNKDALPALYKVKDSNNNLLKEFSVAAIRRLEHGH
ncbi:MAG: HEAT repeat domain-containing protein [Nitrospirae bacterium]|nr:HEAT repeat domain-containing protein [Nitrospirota bacterium]